MLVKRKIPTINEEVITNALTSYLPHEQKLKNRGILGLRFGILPFKYRKGLGNVLIYTPFSVGISHQEVVPNSFLIGAVLHDVTNCHFYYRQRPSKHHPDISLMEHLSQYTDMKQLQTVIQIDTPFETKDEQLSITIENCHSSNISTYKQLIESIWYQNGFNLRLDIHSNDRHDSAKVYEFMTIRVHLPKKFYQLQQDELQFHQLLSAFTAMTIACQQSEVISNEPISLVKISTDTKLTSIFPHHRVDLHPRRMAALGVQENDYVTVWNPLNGKNRRCVVKSNHRFTHEDDVQIGLSTKKRLEITAVSATKLLIQKYPCTAFNKVGVMNVNSIKDGNIIVSKNVYDSLNPNCTLFEMVNTVTGASFDIPCSQIKCNPALEDGTVKLNFLQRQFMDYELPPDILSDYYYHKFYTHPEADTKVQNILKYYENGEPVPFFPYIERQAVKAVLQKVGYVDVKLYPLHDYSLKKEKDSLLKRTKSWIGEKMIRQATLQLKVIRPYSTDEASNIVRMSPHSLKLLGIEETDTIVLKNRAIEVKVRVLAMDSVELVRETSIIPSESSMNISIGIPAPIRNELGLKNVGKIIEAKRCLPYLFRKNLNLQFFSIIAAVLATMSTGLSIGYMVVILCILIPLSIYISFSKVRESISND